MHQVFLGDSTKDQYLATTMVEWLRYPLLPVRNTGKGKLAKSLFYLLQVAIAKLWRLSELIMKNSGTQITTPGMDSIQVFSQRTQRRPMADYVSGTGFLHSFEEGF